MRTTAATVLGGLTAATAVLLLSGCGGSGSSPAPATAAAGNAANCKAALVKQLQDLVASGAAASPDTSVSACIGLDAATLQQISADAVRAVVETALPSALPTGLPSDLPTDLPSGLPSGLPSDLLPTSS